LVRHGWHKWILRKAMEDELPSDVVWRRVKMGFPYPYERFFSTYRDVINLILSKASNPYVNFGRSERLHENWRALSFILWYEYFLNDNRDLFNSIETMVTGREAIREPAYVPEFRRDAVLKVPAN
jgi:asparagine synthase (glutamine-hydrolysing)